MCPFAFQLPKFVNCHLLFSFPCLNGFMHLTFFFGGVFLFFEQETNVEMCIYSAFTVFKSVLEVNITQSPGKYFK